MAGAEEPVGQDGLMDDNPGAAWLPLRFRDVDAFGHVYHAEYLTLLDEARTRWFRYVVGVDNPSEYVLARIEIDYVSSIVLADESVRGKFEIERVGTSSLTLAESLHTLDGRVVSRGRAVTVFRDVGTGTSRRPTDDERRRAMALASPSDSA
jgi:acyl-CoA thioester hydrolase